jgi:hypothetical protein
MIFGSGVMVNMFTLRVIDQGLSPNQVNPKTVKFVFATSLLSMEH